jgi:hypothetical protein
MPAPAKLIFVKNVLMSSVLWTALGNECVLIAGIFAVNWGDKSQMATGFGAVLTALNGLTAILRIFRDNGPVSVSAPASPPATQDVHTGVSVVTVAAPAEQELTSAPAVQKLPVGNSTVAVAPPIDHLTEVPASVVVIKQ